jgi:hypothetical protein
VELIELIGWIAYAFGPICCGILVWDTWKGKAYNSYPFLSGWLFAESLAFVYVWNTGAQLPILANTVVGFFAILVTIVVQVRRKQVGEVNPETTETP